MYEDYLENIVFKALKKVAKKMKFGGNKKKKKSNDTQAQGTEDNTNTNEPKTSKSGSKKRKNSKTNSAKESSGKTQDVAKTTENAESIANGNEDESNETDVVHDNPDENSVSNDNSVTANEEEFSTRSLHFHFGMFFIWCFVTLLQLPTLLTWAHNFKYTLQNSINNHKYFNLIS